MAVALVSNNSCFNRALEQLALMTAYEQ